MIKNIINFIGLILIILVPGFKLSAKNILIIGDSHSCGTFGSTLVKKLSEQNHFVEIFCTVSSSPLNWIQGTTPKGHICRTWVASGIRKSCQNNGNVPKLDWILVNKQYDSVIVALGTNSLGSNSIDPNYKLMVDKIKLSTNSCIWIGPPHLRPDQAQGYSKKSLEQMDENLPSFYKSLGSAIGKTCHVINSLNITKKNELGSKTVDGIHRTSSSGVIWAESILDELTKPINQDSSSMRLETSPKIAN
jgi:hypothetical protein